MIHWLTQSQTELPAPADAMTGGYLNEEEYARMLALKTAKRRQDWLLGRWTAKRLLQTVLWERNGVTLPLDLIGIGNDVTGAPTFHAPLGRLPGALSISHSHGRAFVAVVEKPAMPIGADMEWIQARPHGFAAAYFTAAELELREGVPDALLPLWETAVWSAKEAALKALRLGLSVDTRAVSCLIAPVNIPPQRWRPFAIEVADGRLPQPAPPLSGWWRAEAGFVLTIAVGDDMSATP